MAKKQVADEGINEAAVLEAIVEELDGKEWDADTCENIATILTNAGYTINEPA